MDDRSNAKEPTEPTTHMWPDTNGLTIGCVVELTCGSPPMTVADLFRSGSLGIKGEVAEARAQWFNQTTGMQAEFIAPVACFKLVDNTCRLASAEAALQHVREGLASYSSWAPFVSPNIEAHFAKYPEKP